MSYRCQHCNMQVEPGNSQLSVVVSKREVFYPHGGHGWETAIEKKVCDKCYVNLSENPVIPSDTKDFRTIEDIEQEEMPDFEEFDDTLDLD